MSRRWTSYAMVLCLLFGAAVTAYAQTPTPAGRPAPVEEPPQPPPEKEKPPASGENVPSETYPGAEEEEEPTMTLRPDQEAPHEAFMRLAEFTIRKTELGYSTAGRIPVWPRGAWKLGPMRLFPFGGVSAGWRSNAFQSESEVSSAFVRPFAGLTGSYPFLGGQASLDFGADLSYWYNFDGDVDDYWEAVLGISATWQFYRGFWIRAGYKYEHLTDPVDPELTGQARRNQNYPFVDFGWNDAFGNKIRLETGFEYYKAHYVEDEYATANREEFAAWLKLSVPFVKATSRIYARYTYRWRTAESERINDLKRGHELTGGVEGAIPLSRTERLTGFLEVGWRYDVYEDPSTYTDDNDRVETDDNSDLGGPVVGAGIRYIPGPRTTLDLRLYRNFQFSSRSNYQIKGRVDFTITHTFTPEIVSRLGIFGERTDPSVGDTIYRYGAGAGVRYRIDLNVDIDGSVDYRVTTGKGDAPDYDEIIAQLGLTLYFYGR